MKQFLLLILFCCCLGVFPSYAEDTHVQLNDYTIGCMNSSSTANPLTEVLVDTDLTGLYAFPTGYRCVGIERSGDDASEEVNRMIIDLNKFYPASPETGEEIPDDLEIYISSDNVTFTLLDNTTYITTLETLAGGDLEIMIDGLSITQAYIKLRCVRTLSGFVFAQEISTMVSLYTLNSELFGSNQAFVTATNGYYVESSSSGDPLTTAITNFGVGATVALPYGYSCVGAKKDNSMANAEVSRIIIDLNKHVTSSTENGEEIIDDLVLYVSDDNVNYRLVSYDYARYMGRVSNGIKIVLDGLSITEQYIKLGCPRTASGYVYAKLMAQMIKVVHATDKKQIFALVGFDDEFAIQNPLSQSVTRFGRTSSIAFPYGNSYIGTKKDDSEDGLNVHRIVLNLKKLNAGSSETGSEIVDDLNLYVSNNNVTYTLVSKTYPIYADNVTGGLKVVIDGLDISEKYIKVTCPRALSGYVFGQTEHQSIMSLFRYTPSFVGTTDLPRYTYGSTTFKVSATAKENETLKLSYVPSSGTVQTLWTQTITSDGTVTHSGTMDLQSLPAGKIKLRFELFDVNSNFIDREDAYVFNTTGLVSSGLAVDNVSVIVPQTNDLTGTWGDMSTTVGIDRTVNYKQAQSSDASCTISLPSGVGWCAVYVGLVGGDSRAVVSGLDPSPLTLQLEHWRTDITPAADTVGDAYLGCYDLSSSNTITIARLSGTTPLQITHVVVRKLATTQVNIATQSSSTASRIIYHRDGHTGFFTGVLDSEAALQNTVSNFSNVPIYSFDWCLGTTTVFNIETTSGASFGDNGINPSLYYLDGDRTAGTLVQDLFNDNINPLSVICDKGESQGTTTNVTMRMGAFYGSPYSYALNGPILNDNNDYRQRELDGTYKWTKLSYAYSEVRDYVVGALTDALDSSVDGVHLQFLRHPPFFGYDQPIIDEYITRHGSCSTADYMNANWQQIQRDIMTDMVEDIYDMVQAKAPTGKTIKLKVSFDQENYARQGLDIAAWVDDGWVDVISPGCYAVPAQDFDLSPFVSMVNGTSCKIFPNIESTIMGQDITAEEENGEIEVIRVSVSLNQYRKIFMDMYAQGADGLYTFNYSPSALAIAIEDMKDNEMWREFAEPFIDWFDK